MKAAEPARAAAAAAGSARRPLQRQPRLPASVRVTPRAPRRPQRRNLRLPLATVARLGAKARRRGCRPRPLPACHRQRTGPADRYLRPWRYPLPPHAGRRGKGGRRRPRRRKRSRWNEQPLALHRQRFLADIATRPPNTCASTQHTHRQFADSHPRLLSVVWFAGSPACPPPTLPPSPPRTHSPSHRHRHRPSHSRLPPAWTCTCCWKCCSQPGILSTPSPRAPTPRQDPRRPPTPSTPLPMPPPTPTPATIPPVRSSCPALPVATCPAAAAAAAAQQQQQQQQQQ